MLKSKLSDLTADDLGELCSNKISESRTLEFKSMLPDKSDKGKHELSKDVSAFANSSGGDIIYGIAQSSDGAADHLSPIDCESSDCAIRRIGQTLDSSVEPNIYGIEFHSIPMTGGYALVMRVPASNGSPHRIVVNNGSSRFVQRETGYIRDMSYSEIRSAFAKNANFSDEVRRIRPASVDNIRNKTTWRPLVEGAAGLLQVIPMTTVMGMQSIDIMDPYENYNNYMFNDWGGLSRSVNLDGAIFYSDTGAEQIYAYNQVNRNGVLEAYSHVGGFSTEKTIPALSLADFVRESVTHFTKDLRRMGIDGAVAITLSLSGTKNSKLALGQNFYYRQAPTGDRDLMIIPECIVQNLNDDDFIETNIKNILDIIWQSFGLARCTYYDEAGNWVARR